MKLNLLILSSILFIISCNHKEVISQSEPAVPAITDANTWQSKMALLGSKLTTLLPFLADQKKYADPKNDSFIKSQLKEIVVISKKLNADSDMMKQDPSMRLINTQFEEEINRSLNTFELGLKDYSRFTLKNSTSYCIQCHTRTNYGPAFSGKEFNSTLAQLPALERGEFLSATRNFDAAMKEFESILNESPEKTSFSLWEKATRNSLSIAVKFKQDPDQALGIVNKIISSKKAPKYLNDYAIHWKNSILSWKKEAAPTSLDFNNQLKLSAHLVKAGQVKQANYRHAGDIEFLRATAILHNILGESKNNSQKAEIYWLLGESYDSLTDLDFWQMTEGFYEHCIDALPNSKTSAKCFKKYEDKITMGYTGTAGTDIPAELQQTLKQYRDKSRLK